MLALLLLLAPPELDRPAATAEHANDPIVVDGRLDEAPWEQAQAQAIELQKLPHYDSPPRQPTTFKVIVGPSALYVGIRCESAEGIPITARRTRRDRPIESDRITIDIDSRGLAIDAFHFEVTAGGSIVDGIRYNDTKINLQWDGIWSAAVSEDDGGWTAEVEIPFGILRRPAGATQPIAMQVRRYTTALGETDEWARTPRDGSREVSRYGLLPRVDLAKTVAFGILPYMGMGLQAYHGIDRDPIIVRRFGGDLKLRVGSDLTIDATVFPDFGNIEADTAVVNLSTLEVQFPEKRPFFLEGTDALETPFQLFYSRRIGSLAGTTAGTLKSEPAPARVLEANKLLVRAGSRWTIAAIAAVTEAQDVLVDDPEFGEVTQRVLPTTVYGLVRPRLSLRNAGFVALTAATRTGVNSGPLAPLTSCPTGGAPVHGRCFADVHVFSVDARLRSRTGMWVATGQAVATYRFGAPAEVDIDGNVLTSGDAGGATSATLEKTGGRFIGNATYQWYGRDADWNAMGFLPQPNRHSARVELAWQNLIPHGPVLEERWQLEVYERFTLNGLPNGSGYQVNHRARWRTMWTHFFELHFRPSYWDIRETRDGTPYQRAGLLGLELEGASDSRRKVIAEADVDIQWRTTGPRIDASVNVDMNPLESVQLRLGLTGTADHGEWRWTSTDVDTGSYRFAALHADALGVVGRINVTLPGNLELQAYGQVLGVQTAWRDPRVAPIGSDRIHGSDRIVTSDPPPAGEREAIVVANLFLRWEYRRGSNLWLVLTRNPVETVFGDGTGRIDLHRAVTLPASWLVMAKLTFWLDGEWPIRRRRRPG